MIRVIALFFLIFISSLKADVTIRMTGDKDTLLINQTLTATVTLTYTQEDPPELFSFMYNLMKQPETSFRIVTYNIDPVKVIENAHMQAIHFVLAPTRTGILIFAPGIISFGQQNYLVPALKIECESAGLSSLPIAGLLPLYPERRIVISTANFMMIMNEKALQNAKLHNKETYQKYRLAWDTLALGILAVAFALLLLWCIMYYELLSRALKPLLAVETPLQKLLKELQKSNEIRPSLLSEVLRTALGEKFYQDFHGFSLTELSEYVATKDIDQKDTILASIQELKAISYAGKSITLEEWQVLQKTLLSALHL